MWELPHSPASSSTLVTGLCLIPAVLVGMMWYLTVALICTSLVAHEGAPFPVLKGCVYIFFGETSVRSLGHLKSGLFVFLLLSRKGSLYILTPIPYQIPNLQTFPPFCGLSFSTQSLGVDIEMGPETYLNTYEIRDGLRAGDLVSGEMHNFTLPC